MISFSTFRLLPIAMTCLILLAESGISSNAQESNGDAPRPLSSYEQYLSDCAAKLYPPCGSEIFFSVFVGNQTTSNECCYSLVNELGQRCHEDMTRYILGSANFKNNRISIWKRSKKVWDDCIYSLLSLPPSESIDPAVFNFN